eukprot:CAMPEP_0170525880 /NCGR_PEP_ID=MMETSP0209-20121228/11318_1 /TAXON_ID=665100 ORGANISM="Litonotus pictus, Strain P1" /NCGR_SAMPLE_ID=MMETSP0209 /ASSEMBLY_ACC=CAM_ASM_000301 /LENGTH=225 /DNA_ID=CAMNT_0010815377 /DNA_START=61 /DNA_END=734 /DNA_ORIENTATION=-
MNSALFPKKDLKSRKYDLDIAPIREKSDKFAEEDNYYDKLKAQKSKYGTEKAKVLSNILSGASKNNNKKEHKISLVSKRKTTYTSPPIAEVKKKAKPIIQKSTHNLNKMNSVNSELIFGSHRSEQKTINKISTGKAIRQSVEVNSFYNKLQKLVKKQKEVSKSSASGADPKRISKLSPNKNQVHGGLSKRMKLEKINKKIDNLMSNTPFTEQIPQLSTTSSKSRG